MFDSTRLDDAESCQHASRLGAGLLELALRIGVGNDSAAGTQFDAPPCQAERADQDVHVHGAVTVEKAERAGVGATAGLFQLRDDLHATEFRDASDGAARKYR